MTITATITVTGDDAKFGTVLAAAGATAAVPAPTSGGTTAPAPTFTQSANGSVAMAPPPIDGARSGTITDEYGNNFWLQYSAADKFPAVYVSGNVSGLADQLTYVYGIGPNGANEVWSQDLAAVYVWRGNTWLAQPTLPTIPPGPILAPPAAPAPVIPPGSVVPVATPVTATATGMAAAIAAAAAQATVTLAAGVYTETAPLAVPMTLTGAGETTTTINCQGITPFFKKAILVPEVAGDTIEAMSLTGAAIDNGDGGNAAGVRDNGDGIGFALKTVEIYGCQMGVLTFASPIAMDSCHIHDNGNATAGAGTHNVYVGAGPSFALTNSVVEHCTHEHEVKSRSLNTMIAGCTITTGGMGNCIDIPDGGLLTVSNTTLALGKAADPASQDTVVLHYGEESANNVAAGVAIVLTDVVIDTTALPGISAIIALGSFIPQATLTLTNVTYKGDTAPSFQGFAAANITGTIAKAAA